MGARELRKLMEEAKKLPIAEKLQLITYLVEQCRRDYLEPGGRRKWAEIGGRVSYPLTGENAQDWVSRTRAESDEHRTW
jgi:hypothetical protein